jgi:RNA polymerase sigma-70 factor (ECF subfamily)
VGATFTAVDDGTTRRGSEPAQGLIDRAVRGDRIAIDHLLQTLLPQLYRISSRLTDDPADAEEIAQESAYVVLKALPRFERRCQIGTWLYAIVRSQVSRKYRRTRCVPLSCCPGVREPDDELAFLAEADASPDLADALDLLAPLDREIFLSRELEGLSSQEVAHRVHLTPSAVKSRLHRARVHMREHFAADPIGHVAA